MEKKVAIITGAAGGIGRKIVEKFIADQYAVVLVDLSEEGMLEANSWLKLDSTDYLVLAGDLTNDDFLQQIVATTLEKWGRIDALINNAMWRRVESIHESTPENWNLTLAIGITAPAFLSKYVARALIANKQACTIINVSSVMASLTAGYASAYSVCKGAIESLTYELATLYGPRGFRVVAVRPGSVDTSLSNDYSSQENGNVSSNVQNEIDDRTPLKRAADPMEIAAAISWLCSDQASFITGTTLTIDGGLTHNFNPYAIKKLIKPNEF